jgi:hypothetical protein
MNKFEYTNKVMEVKDNIIKDLTNVVNSFLYHKDDIAIKFVHPIYLSDDTYKCSETIGSILMDEEGEINLSNDEENRIYHLNEVNIEVLALIMDKLLDSKAFTLEEF